MDIRNLFPILNTTVSGIIKISREEKQTLREYFNIKSITQSRRKEGYDDIDEYYLFLKTKKFNTEEELKKNKIDNKKKLKKKRNKQNKKLKQNNIIEQIQEEEIQEEQQIQEEEQIGGLKNPPYPPTASGIAQEENSSDTDIECEVYIQYKPKIYFSKRLKDYNKKYEIIDLLNNLYDNSETYKIFLQDNKYDLIKIVKEIHTGYHDPLHFNGFFKSFNHQDSKTYHFYINDNKVTQLSQIHILNL